MAAFFGAGPSTDAYFVAYSAALLIGGTLGQAIEVAIVPFVARETVRDGGSPRQFLKIVSGHAALIGGALWCVITVPVALVRASTHGSAVLPYAICFTLLVTLWGAASVYSGALISQWKIGRATASNLWRGAGALLGMAAALAGADLWTVAVGLGLGELCRFLYVRHHALKQIPPGLGKDPGPVRACERAVAAQAVGGAAGGAAPLVERLLAVSLGAGGVSHLEYAARLLAVPAVLFDGAIAPLLLARWSQEIAAHGHEPPRAEVLRIVAKGLALALACALALVAAAPLVVHLLLAHGRFTSTSEVAVASLLQLLSVGFVATMGALMLERFYLASTRNRTLAVLSFCRAAIRVLSVWLLLPSSGLTAFAIGYALADWSYLVILVALLRPASAAAGVVSARTP